MLKSKVPETEFGRLIFERRIALGMSQAKLARRISVADGTVSVWETTLHPRISAGNISRLAEVFKIEEEIIKATILPKIKGGSRGWGPGAPRKPLTKFGELIQDRRIGLRMTRKKLGELTGFEVRNLGHWESGTTSPYPHPAYVPKVVEKLATALQIEPEKIAAVIPEIVAWQPQSEFGRFIRERRRSLNLTVEMFASKLGWPLDRVRSVEKGNRALKPKFIVMWAKALELSPDELRGKFVRRKQLREPKNEFGSFIRERRQTLGLTMRQLAKMTGIGFQRISEMELGSYSPSSGDLFEKLAVALQINALELKTKELEAAKGTDNMLGKNLKVLGQLLEKQKSGRRLLLVKGEETVELDLAL